MLPVDKPSDSRPVRLDRDKAAAQTLAHRVYAPSAPPRRMRADWVGSWCHNGTMKRINIRDVPEEVYAALVATAENNRQSLNSFVVDRLAEVARTARVSDYVTSYPVPNGTGVTLEDAVEAVREIRETS